MIGRVDRRLRCKACGSVTPEREMLTAPSPFGGDALIACPECKSICDGSVILCDEPGCMAEASCGYPTGNDADDWGGYRYTCRRHRRP